MEEKFHELLPLDKASEDVKNMAESLQTQVRYTHTHTHTKLAKTYV